MHPYWQEDQAEYAKRARAYDIKPPALLGMMPAPASNAEVSAMLHRCLSPDPEARPTAPAIRAALSGRAPKTATAAHRQVHAPRWSRSGRRPAWRETKPVPAAGSKLKSDRIRLVASRWRVAADRHAHRDRQGACFAASGPTPSSGTTKQCTVERRADGQWIVTPAPGTVNETLINGAPLTTPRALSDGDVLAAGRSAKGISKLPLTAHVG